MRKWNKLLALVLAMVMVFGLTATAFAEEATDEDTNPDAVVTSEGDEDAAPADDEDAAPADDETAAPADDEDAAPADAAPAADVDLSDVADWAKAAVSTVLEKDLMTAGANGFEPKTNMTRADLVVALYVLAGSPSTAGAANPFEDVATGDSFKDAVVWAYTNEIVTGKSETKFDPNGDVKRQEIAKILFVYANAENVAEDNLAKFADADKIAGWAKDYVNWANAKGLINGKAAQQNTVNMDPTGTATRQEVAVILMNYINNILPADDTADAPADDATAPADDDADAPADDAAGAPADDAADAPADDAAGDAAGDDAGDAAGDDADNETAE